MKCMLEIYIEEKIILISLTIVFTYSETSQSTDEANGSIEIESSIEVSTEDCEEKQAAAETTKRQTKHKKNIQKNHICQYCGRGFPSISLLATHNRIHTGEK